MAVSRVDTRNTRGKTERMTFVTAGTVVVLTKRVAL